jgi:hypothetical protein
MEWYNMTEDQKSTLRDAFVDLMGSFEEKEFGEHAGFGHDWEGHLCTIRDLFERFPELNSDPKKQEQLEKFEDRILDGVE